MDLSMFTLTGRVAIVTGAGRGNGKAIALGFAQAGADVVIADINAAEGEEVAAKIRDEGRKALAVSTDVRDIDQVANLLDKTLASFSRIDILVNNAGGPIIAGALDMSVDTWKAVLDLNLNSVFICSKIVGEVMVKQNAGNIISISSVAGVGPAPVRCAYGAAKAGIISLTKSLAVEFAPHNIRVNAIAPGMITTPAFYSQASESSKFRQGQLKRIPLGRFGKPEDIAAVAIFLASDASAYVTGETIVASGGLTTTVYDNW